MEKMVPLNSSGNLLLISSLSLPQTANRPQKGSMLNSRREQESRFIHVNKLLYATLYELVMMLKRISETS